MGYSTGVGLEESLSRPNSSNAIVQRLWNYCNVLRDDGMSYGDYVEQLTYLRFLKMDSKQQLARLNRTTVTHAGSV